MQGSELVIELTRYAVTHLFVARVSYPYRLVITTPLASRGPAAITCAWVWRSSNRRAAFIFQAAVNSFFLCLHDKASSGDAAAEYRHYGVGLLRYNPCYCGLAFFPCGITSRWRVFRAHHLSIPAQKGKKVREKLGHNKDSMVGRSRKRLSTDWIVAGYGFMRFFRYR